MSLKLNVIGMASGKTFILPVGEEEGNMSLMDFLISHDIRIASSCSGEGVCKKCIVNESLISCQILVRDFLQTNNEVRVSYL